MENKTRMKELSDFDEVRDLYLGFKTYEFTELIKRVSGIVRKDDKTFLYVNNKGKFTSFTDEEKEVFKELRNLTLEVQCRFYLLLSRCFEVIRNNSELYKKYAGKKGQIEDNVRKELYSITLYKRKQIKNAERMMTELLNN